MYKSFLWLISVLLFVGCTRQSLAPLEVKIEDGEGGIVRVSEVKDTYTVKAGDTIPSIAAALDIDPNSLASFNGLAVNAKLKVGQVLKLPRNDSSGELLTTSYTPVQIDDAGVQQNQEKQAQNKENDELDARLSKILDEDASKQSDQNGKKVIPLGQNSGFNEQESALASPKITHTAKGETVSSARTTEVSGKMQMPTKGKVVSRFGEMIDGIPNDGINIKASAGTPVNAVSDGEVVYAGNKLDESFGNVVIVKHNDGLISSYANMQDIAKGMRQGAKVKAGQRVGTVGMTGDVSTPQLHFEIMKDNTPLNPEKYLNM